MGKNSENRRRLDQKEIQITQTRMLGNAPKNTKNANEDIIKCLINMKHVNNVIVKFWTNTNQVNEDSMGHSTYSNVTEGIIGSPSRKRYTRP